MAYQVVNLTELTQLSGLNVSHTTYDERLEAALNSQKRDRGMELVAIDNSSPNEPLFVFAHETDLR